MSGRRPAARSGRRATPSGAKAQQASPPPQKPTLVIDSVIALLRNTEDAVGVEYSGLNGKSDAMIALRDVITTSMAAMLLFLLGDFNEEVTQRLSVENPLNDNATFFESCITTASVNFDKFVELAATYNIKMYQPPGLPATHINFLAKLGFPDARPRYVSLTSTRDIIQAWKKIITKMIEERDNKDVFRTSIRDIICTISPEAVGLKGPPGKEKRQNNERFCVKEAVDSYLQMRWPASPTTAATASAPAEATDPPRQRSLSPTESLVDNSPDYLANLLQPVLAPSNHTLEAPADKSAAVATAAPSLPAELNFVSLASFIPALPPATIIEQPPPHPDPPLDAASAPPHSEPAPSATSAPMIAYAEIEPHLLPQTSRRQQRAAVVSTVSLEEINMGIEMIIVEYPHTIRFTGGNFLGFDTKLSKSPFFVISGQLVRDVILEMATRYGNNTEPILPANRNCSVGTVFALMALLAQITGETSQLPAATPPLPDAEIADLQSQLEILAVTMRFSVGVTFDQLAAFFRAAQKSACSLLETNDAIICKELLADPSIIDAQDDIDLERDNRIHPMLALMPAIVAFFLSAQTTVPMIPHVNGTYRPPAHNDALKIMSRIMVATNCVKTPTTAEPQFQLDPDTRVVDMYVVDRTYYGDHPPYLFIDLAPAMLLGVASPSLVCWFRASFPFDVHQLCVPVGIIASELVKLTPATLASDPVNGARVFSAIMTAAVARMHKRCNYAWIIDVYNAFESHEGFMRAFQSLPALFEQPRQPTNLLASSISDKGLMEWIGRPIVPTAAQLEEVFGIFKCGDTPVVWRQKKGGDNFNDTRSISSARTARSAKSTAGSARKKAAAKPPSRRKSILSRDYVDDDDDDDEDDRDNVYTPTPSRKRRPAAEEEDDQPAPKRRAVAAPADQPPPPNVEELTAIIMAEVLKRLAK